MPAYRFNITISLFGMAFVLTLQVYRDDLPLPHRHPYRRGGGRRGRGGRGRGGGRSYPRIGN
ncbi:hypothetical protein FOQG_12622 [Fusarium oxysporum f. sp. raphani 54005]|uniref:Uncharacterized protein n=2 Tax=Fusarium oxysporum TaxID=5507 RepID=X0BVZ8_FUSOX|nr:hypothetical protein FOVG_05419 [Fusarium oxysporum f. sp. pisi HDV247]EXK83103.1 hypothetical protein FOQG_12622 [Fusarium oxysporum f. sp. raphani 54005]KAJ4030365.1 hypothetical protein NW753_013904 [Fusarium oxysporum]KAJ4068941.1 hypothetical protein NW763_002506 [Fusarium oxysporum]KAJ4081367.1 hypothetical protein NW756_010245 [Fusarium oxysporum]